MDDEQGTGEGATEAGEGAPPRRRWRRLAWPALVVPLAVVAACQLGVSPGARFTVVNEHGDPADDAYVAYSYRGHVFNFVDSISYEVSGGAVRADRQGRVTIPPRLYRKGPLDTYAVPWVELLYVPELHFARPVGRRSVSTPGLMDADQNGRRLAVHDLSDDPEGWERSLEVLESFLWSNVIGPQRRPRQAGVELSSSAARELGRQLRQEYEELLARHATTPRRPPSRSPYLESRPVAEREEIIARIREDLAREPLWGPRLERSWRGRLEQVDRAVAELP